MIVRSACGTAPPLDPDEPRPAACLGCGAAPTWVQLDASEPWARFSGAFACPSCGLDSPLGELPIDGGARCLHCDAEHPIDLYEVRAILAMGHASCDVALGRVPATLEHPSMDLRGEAFLSTEGELELRMLPGVPLCTTCHAPLRVARDGNAEVAACPTCGPLGRYHVVEGAVYDGLSALLCDAYRKEPPARQAPGAIALTCPGCGAPLPLPLARARGDRSARVVRLLQRHVPCPAGDARTRARHADLGAVPRGLGGREGTDARALKEPPRRIRYGSTMDRGSRVFWGLVVALGTASTFFGVSAERARRSVQQAAADVETGDLVELASVLDGDTVLVTTRAGGQVTVRIVGIKAFSAEGTRDDALPYGREAMEVLRNTLQGKPTRVLVHAPRKDARGRTLASLYVEDRDVAIELVGRGLVLVYTAYPFPGMAAYLDTQGRARAQKAGIWSSAGATARAEGLSREWASEAAR